VAPLAAAPRTLAAVPAACALSSACTASAWVLPTAARASAASSLLGRDRRRDARQCVLVRLRSDVSRGHLQQESEDGVRTTGVRHAAEHRSQERGTAQPRRALAGSGQRTGLTVLTSFSYSSNPSLLSLLRSALANL